jgi:uncharacterized protein (TIGR02466 family)
MNELFLFATPVGITKIDKKHCHDVLIDIKTLISDNKVSPDYTGRSFFTGDNILEIPSVFELMKVINEHVKVFSQKTLGLENDSLVLQCVWGNINSSGVSHPIHQHPNSFLSGAFYVDIPHCEYAGDLFFIDPRQAKNMQHGNFVKQSCISDRNWYIKPETGMLVLFPSWLEHGTQPFISSMGNQRVSISFNYKLSKCDEPTMYLR